MLKAGEMNFRTDFPDASNGFGVGMMVAIVFAQGNDRYFGSYGF